MQFDWFLSVLEQKWLENLDIYSIGAAELPLEFPNCTPLPKGDGDTSSLGQEDSYFIEEWSLVIFKYRGFKKLWNL